MKINSIYKWKILWMGSLSQWHRVHTWVSCECVFLSERIVDDVVRVNPINRSENSVRTSNFWNSTSSRYITIAGWLFQLQKKLFVRSFFPLMQSAFLKIKKVFTLFVHSMSGRLELWANCNLCMSFIIWFQKVSRHCACA